MLLSIGRIALSKQDKIPENAHDIGVKIVILIVHRPLFTPYFEDILLFDTIILSLSSPVAAPLAFSLTSTASAERLLPGNPTYPGCLL